MTDGTAATATTAERPLTVARTVEEVELLRDFWLAMSVTNIDADIDFFVSVVNNFTSVVRPHVVFVPRRNESDLLAVARLEDAATEIKVGYRVVARPRMKRLVGSFDGFVGVQSEEDRRILLDQLADALRAGEADSLLLPKVPVDDPLHVMVSQMGDGVRAGRSGPSVAHWTADVPSSIDELLASRSGKARRQLRYYERRLRDKVGGALQVRRFDSIVDLEELFDSMESVAARSYQRRIGVGYMGSPIQRAIMTDAVAARRLIAWVVYAGSRPIAFWWGYRYAGVFLTETPGYDPEFSEERVGTFTMMCMLDDLCSDEGVHTVDFGHGDAEYKSAFGSVSRREADIELFSSGLRPRMFDLSSRGAVKLNGAAKAAMADSAWGRRLKSRMRTGR